MSITTVEEIAVDLIARTERLERQLASASNVVDRRLGGMESRTQQFVGKFNGLLAGVSAAVLARELLTIADASKQLDAQLKLATASFGSLAVARDDVRRLALETRSGLDETTKLYGNFVRATEQIGGTQEQAARATETFSKALKIGGADANAAASATLQFGQALASGALRGDEFNSIAEASPRILKLLADALGVPQGAIRALAAEGKLTSDVLFRALTDRKFTAGIDAEFKELPTTFDQAMQQVSNAATITFGAFDRGGQFSNALVNFLSTGTDSFAGLEKAAVDTGINVRAVFAGLSDVFSPLVAGSSRAFAAIRNDAEYTRTTIANILRAADRLTAIAAGGANFINDVGSVAQLKLLGPKLARGRVERVAGTDYAGTFERGDAKSRKEARLREAIRRLEGQGFVVPLLPNGLPDEANIRRRPKVALPPTPTQTPTSRSGRVASASGAASGKSQSERDADEAVKLFENVTRDLRKAVEDIAIPPSGDPLAGLEDSVRYRQDTERLNRDDANRAADEVIGRQEERIRGLASVLEDAFTSSSDQFWNNFKRNGLQAIALIAARAAVLSFSKGGGGFGSLLGNLATAAGAATGLSSGGGGSVSLSNANINNGGLIDLKFGRASGGFVGAGQLVRVNEGASPGRMEGFRPVGSGTVIPLGGMAAIRPQASAGNTYQITVMANNSVTPAGFAQGLAKEILTEAKRMDAATAQGTLRAAPGYLSQRQRLGS